MTANLLQTDRQADVRAREVARERLRREKEALRLYRPLPTTRHFHLSAASERLLRGGNQSSKTTSAAAEVASAATRTPLHDIDGTEIPFRYPTNRPLLIWITGYDETHIGSTIYPKLFEPGAFEIIKNAVTGQWRVFRGPDDPEDGPRINESEPAPPFIDPRHLIWDAKGYWEGRPAWDSESFTWKSKGARQFSICRLANGTTIWAFPSGGNCPQGMAVDLIWIDEDIAIPSHVYEWQARLPKVNGRLIWSAWPHDHNDALMKMTDRAEADAIAVEHGTKESPDVVEWKLRFDANPFISLKERMRTIEAWGHEVAKSRNEGEYCRDSVLVFPHFNIKTHGIKGTGCPAAIRQALEESEYIPPSDWTNYLGVDPGTAHPAVLMATVPPPTFGDFLVVFDEIFGYRYSPDELASTIKQRYPELVWQAFVIDERFGRQVQFTSGKSSKQQLGESFAAVGLASRDTGSYFAKGTPDTNGRNALARGWMMPRSNGTTKILAVEHKTRYLQQQMKLYKLKVQRTDVMDDVVRKNNDLPDALGYICAYGPVWVEQPAPEKPKEISNADWLYRWKKDMGLPVTRRDRGCFLGAGAVPANEMALT